MSYGQEIVGMILPDSWVNLARASESIGTSGHIYLDPRLRWEHLITSTLCEYQLSSVLEQRIVPVSDV